jgi:hypothetical protein
MSASQVRAIIEKREPRGNLFPKARPKFQMGTSNEPPERYKGRIWDARELLPLCICECGNYISARGKGLQTGVGPKHRRVVFKCEFRNEKWHKGNFNDTYTVLIPDGWGKEGES